MRIIRAAAVAFAIAPCVSSAVDMSTAELINIDGAILGKVTFEQTPTGALMRFSPHSYSSPARTASASALPPGR